MNNSTNRKDMPTKPIYQPMRKSCQFCRRRKIKCIIEKDKTRCKACTTRDQDCIFARKGTIDDHSPPPPNLYPSYRGRSLPSGHASTSAALVPANPEAASGSAQYPPYHEQASYAIANSQAKRFQPSYKPTPAMQAAARPSRVKTLPIRRDASAGGSSTLRTHPYPSNRLYSTPQQRSISVPNIPTLRYQHTPQTYAAQDPQAAPAGYYSAGAADSVYIGQQGANQYQYVPASTSSWIYRGQGGLEPQYEAGSYPSYEYYTYGTGQPAYSNERGGGFEVFATPPQASTSAQMGNEGLAPGWQMTPHSLYNETLSTTPSLGNEEKSVTPSDNSPNGSVRFVEPAQPGSAQQIYHSSGTATAPSYYQATGGEETSPSAGYAYIGHPQEASSTMYAQAMTQDPTLHYYQAQSPVNPEHSSFYPLDGLPQPLASGSGSRYQQDREENMTEADPLQ